MKIRILGPDRRRAVLIRGWIWKEHAYVRFNHGSWQYEVNGKYVSAELHRLLNIAEDLAEERSPWLAGEPASLPRAQLVEGDI